MSSPRTRRESALSALRPLVNYQVPKYLVQLAVAAIVDELKSDIGTVLGTGNVLRAEVDGEAEVAFAGGLEERHHELELSAGAEVIEAGRILDRRNDTTHYQIRF